MPDKNQYNIQAILESIEKIFTYSKPCKNADEFYGNTRDFEAALMNFVVIGEMVSKLTSDFMDKHQHIDWLKIRGFRNIIAHDYFGIDAEEVWDIIKKHLPKLKKDLKQINV